MICTRRPAAVLLALLAAACSDDPGDNVKPATALPDAGGLFYDLVAGSDESSAAPDLPLNCPGAAFCPCAENNECDSDWCIWTPEGKQCAEICVTNCPEGFKCAQPQGSDAVNLCVPRWGHLCDPCTESSTCASLGLDHPACVDQGAAGSFCGAPCVADTDCPSGYSCAVSKNSEGTQSKQCVRAQGTDCLCSQWAGESQLSTACFVDGPGGGQCAGTRSCTTEGLGDCTVPPTSEELCDGMDNDCDGSTDNGACDDDNPCTQDVCDPSKKGDKACSFKNVDVQCDADDNLCTDGDMCSKGVCTPGTAKGCDDKNPCTLDGCDPAKGCVATDDDGKPCDDENPCTVGDACQGGGCSAGQSKVCSSEDPCVVAKCDLTRDGKCVYNAKAAGAPCDDGDGCTVDATCVSGNCTGKPANCDDQNACTSDSCTKAIGCQHAPANDGAACNDGNGCTQGGGCQGGVCKAGTPVSCDDADPCTTDTCDSQSGKCAHVPNSQPCDDGNACTQSDTCAGGACVGQGKSCDDNNPCTDDSCDPATKVCKNIANSKPCDDANACTQGDVCKAGACSPGAGACNNGDPCKANGDCLSGVCLNGVCASALKCGPLGTTSNGLLGEVVIDKAASINTNTGTLSWGGNTIGGEGKPGVTVKSQSAIGGVGAPQIRVLHFKSLKIAQGVTVKVSGTLGLALIAQTTLEVAGSLDAAGASGTSGKTNVAGSAGASGPAGYKGGGFISGQGCINNAGKAQGPGAGPGAACGGPGSDGGQGSDGGGGGGGGGACGGTGGNGGGHASTGEAGFAGAAATNGANATGFSGSPGAGSAGCSGGQSGGMGSPYGAANLQSMYGGSGGSGGGDGGFGGFGGKASNSCSSVTAGGDPGFSGGGGGGGGGGGALLLCASSKVAIAASGVVSVQGGSGGSGGAPGSATMGKNPTFNIKCIAGGGGGGGRSGGGGGGGGGSGGSGFLSSATIEHNGTIKAGGGVGGGQGFAFSGGSGGFGKNGGGNGGKGGSGGTGGKGGKGGDGYIRVEAGKAFLNGTYSGKLSQGGI